MSSSNLENFRNFDVGGGGGQNSYAPQTGRSAEKDILDQMISMTGVGIWKLGPVTPATSTPRVMEPKCQVATAEHLQD